MIEANLSMMDTIAMIKGFDVSEYRRDRMILFMINKPPYLPNYIALMLALATN